MAPTPVVDRSTHGPGLLVVDGEVRDCEARVTSREACPGLAAFLRDSSRSVDTLPPERAIFFYGRRGREGALVITTPGQVAAPQVPVGADRDPLVIVDGQRLLCPLRVLDGRNSPSPTDSLSGHNCRGEKPLMAQDIVAVDVLKGPAPLRYFGPGAANGVIVIATKRLGITPRVRPDTSGLTGTAPGVKLPRFDNEQ